MMLMVREISGQQHRDYLVAQSRNILNVPKRDTTNMIHIAPMRARASCNCSSSDMWSELLQTGTRLPAIGMMWCTIGSRLKRVVQWHWQCSGCFKYSKGSSFEASRHPIGDLTSHDSKPTLTILLMIYITYYYC